MGLIKAGMGALGGTLADQWKEFFYCDSLDKDVLMVKGQKRTSRRSSNNGEDNIITNGSGIAVADGQCMLIVEQGRVVEVCAEPGEFTFDASTEPSVFTGNFGDSLAETFQTVAKRFTYGGDTGKDQRVYYINTKELGEILYGTATPIPFRVVVSEERGYKLSVNLRCNGSFTCRICDPLLFYTNVCSNVSTQYDASEIAPRLKSELLNALQPALATLSANKVQYYEIPAHTLEISEALNEQLSNVWRKKRGIEMARENEISVRGMVMVRPADKIRGRASHSTPTVRLARNDSNISFFEILFENMTMKQSIQDKPALRSRGFLKKPTKPTKIL